MLVLTRRLGEEIRIGDGITVTVLSVRGDHVRLGITAPPSLRVDRLEVHERRGRADAPEAEVCPPKEPSTYRQVEEE